MTATLGETLSRTERWSVLGANYLSAIAVGLAIGGFIPLVALSMEKRGFEPWIIGANASTAALGIVLIAPFVPAIMGRLGVARAMIGGVVIGTSCIALFPFVDSLWAWFLLRFVGAAGIAIHWVLSETWMNAVATKGGRGRALAIYVTLMAGGFAIGPALIGVVGTDGYLPFMIFAVALGVSAFPLVLVRHLGKDLMVGGTGSPMLLARAAPTVLAAAITTGLYDAAIMPFLPIWGLRLGFEEATAVGLLTWFLLGNAVLQLPIGWLADRFDRRAVLLLCGVVGIAGPLMAPFFVDGPIVLVVFLLVWGGFAFGPYTVGLVMIGERFRGGELAAANAAFVMCFEIATMSGPTMAGVAMDLWEPHGLMALLTVVATLFAGFGVYRGVRRKFG